MRLHLQREQRERTGVFGRSQGWEFSLFYQLELNPQEQVTLKRYVPSDHLLAEFNDPNGKEIRISVDSAQQGARYDAVSFTDALNCEQMIHSSCKKFKLLLDEVERWNGRRVIEIG